MFNFISCHQQVCHKYVMITLFFPHLLYSQISPIYTAATKLIQALQFTTSTRMCSMEHGSLYFLCFLLLFLYFLISLLPFFLFKFLYCLNVVVCDATTRYVTRAKRERCVFIYSKINIKVGVWNLSIYIYN